ncbi:hypothetical protein [Streptomyces sp. NPDC002690]
MDEPQEARKSHSIRETPKDQESQGPRRQQERHPSPPAPRRHPWIWASLLVLVGGTGAVMLCAVGWFVFAAMTGAFFVVTNAGTEVSCDEAMAFARRELPVGAYDRRCETRGALDTEYDVRFRTTARELTGWLDSAFPDAADTGLRAKYCDEDVDACAHLELADPPPDGAVAADVTVVYEDGGSVLVHFSPFNV